MPGTLLFHGNQRQRGKESLLLPEMAGTGPHILGKQKMAILGTSGAGKTFTMQLMALRMRRKGIPIFMGFIVMGNALRIVGMYHGFVQKLPLLMAHVRNQQAEKDMEPGW